MSLTPIGHWTGTATHKDEFMGMPPTAKQVTITGIRIDRIAGGKIVASVILFG